MVVSFFLRRIKDKKINSYKKLEKREKKVLRCVVKLAKVK